MQQEPSEENLNPKIVVRPNDEFLENLCKSPLDKHSIATKSDVNYPSPAYPFLEAPAEEMVVEHEGFVDYPSNHEEEFHRLSLDSFESLSELKSRDNK